MRSSSRDHGQRQGAFRFLARALALALLALHGAGYLLPSLHFATVEHEICAEHGEVEHAEPAASSDHLAPAQTGKSALFAGAGAAEHTHESCSVGALSAPGAVVERSRDAVPLALVEAPARGVVVEAAAKSSVTVLSYAPKLAPPA